MAATSQAFWDKAADKYDRRTVKGPNYAARIERAAAWAGCDARVLDVGCAGGQISLDLAKRVGSVQGIDLSPRLIELAKARCEAEGVANCGFDVLTPESDRLASGGFDAVTAYSVLHLVPDARQAIQRFTELLRPGGRVIAEVPTRTDIGLHWRILIRAMTAVGKAPVVRIYHQREYEQMFSDAGFTIEEVKVY